MSSSNAPLARIPARRKIFVISLPPATSGELSPLSESTSLPPVPFERGATNDGGQTVGHIGSNTGTSNPNANASNGH